MAMKPKPSPRVGERLVAVLDELGERRAAVVHSLGDKVDGIQHVNLTLDPDSAEQTFLADVAFYSSEPASEGAARPVAFPIPLDPES